MNYAEFIDRVAVRARVASDQAVVLARATLQTLAERLTGGEAWDLASQLPKGLQDPLRKRGESAERFGLGEAVRRVGDRAGVNDIRARDGVSAVLTTLREAVSGGEFGDVISQLPADFREVLQPVR